MNAALIAIGRAPLAIEAILPMIGDGARVLALRALSFEGLHPSSYSPPTGGARSEPELLERTIALFLEHYAQRPVVHTALLPGARETLALGLPCALVTNKPRSISLLVIEQLGIASAFKAVFAGGDGPLKPSPHGIQHVVAQLGIPITHAWMIGDGPQDILAGRAAGCFTVAVLGGIADETRLLAADPDLVVSSLHEVARLLG